MKSTYTLGIAATIFIILGLVLLNNLLPSQQMLSNSAVGFVVANGAAEKAPSNGIISNINGFFVRGNLAPDVREKYLPIYILLNILFIVSIIITFYKKYKR